MMNKQNGRSTVGVAAVLVCVVILTIAGTLSFSSLPHYLWGVQAQRVVQYKVLMYQGASEQQLEGMLNSAGRDGWKFVQMAGPFVIFQK